MRRFGILVIVGVAMMTILAASWAPVFAWEIKLKGETEWRYRYWTRTGDTDIFGQMSPDLNLGINHLQTFPTHATTNRGSGTFGVLAGENRFGSDMSLTDYRMTIFPKFVVNKAISVEGSVNLTSLGIWSDGEPLVGSGTAPNRGGTTLNTFTNVGYVNSLYVPIQDRAVAVDVPNTYVTLQWLKTSLHMPMLDFSIGYKNSGAAMGLWKHKCNRASASFGMTAHYGPFKIGMSPYFGRAESSWELAGRSRIEGAGAPRRQEDRRDYFRAIQGEFQYNSGCFSFLLLSDSYLQPGAANPDQRGADIFTANHDSQRPSEDIIRYRFILGAKYFNGRFFFNGEADWWERWRSGRGTADPSSGAGARRIRQNRDNQAWLYGLETGVVTGPSKVTFNYVRATGDDPSTRHNSEDASDGDSGVTDCYMKYWGYLMYYMYGTGDGWDAAGYGQPTNFQHVGAKLDYAVASNLNIWAVYAYAWRDQPNAYRLAGNYRLGIQQWTNEDIRLSQLGTFRGQAVPDSAREIGWEVDLGINWKLLEGLTWDTTLAYWKPGSWWGYAYPNTAAIYRAGVVPNDNPNNAAGEALAAFDLGRDIDPLFAVETNLQIHF